MIFRSEEILTEEKVQSALRNIIRDGVPSQATGILTGGAFLLLLRLFPLLRVLTLSVLKYFFDCMFIQNNDLSRHKLLQKKSCQKNKDA